MKNILSLIIGFSLFLLFSCRQESSQQNDRQVCFCDSTYDNTSSDTIREFICYKGTRVYKLQQWKDRISLSRHSLQDNRWLYENLECTHDNKIIPQEYQFFLSIDKVQDSIEVTYVYKSLDSMRVILEHGNDTIFSSSVLTNKVRFDKKAFEDSTNFISFYGFTHDSLPHPETKIVGLATKTNSIKYPTTYLLNNSLDQVLLKFRQCIGKTDLK